jgi:hypothetical protein
VPDVTGVPLLAAGAQRARPDRPLNATYTACAREAGCRSTSRKGWISMLVSALNGIWHGSPRYVSDLSPASCSDTASRYVACAKAVCARTLTTVALEGAAGFAGRTESTSAGHDLVVLAGRVSSFPPGREPRVARR